MRKQRKRRPTKQLSKAKAALNSIQGSHWVPGMGRVRMRTFLGVPVPVVSAVQCPYCLGSLGSEVHIKTTTTDCIRIKGVVVDDGGFQR